MSTPSRVTEKKLADAMPHIVWTHDGAGVPTYFNKKWTEYTGLDLAETLRVGPDTLVHPEDLPEVQRMAQQARERGAPFEASYRLRGRDGALRWHHAYIVPLHEDGGVVAWVGTARRS